MKHALAIIGVLAIVDMTLAAGFQTDDFAPNNPVPVPEVREPAKPVRVVNDVLPVEGVVTVTNLGDVQLAGAVEVTNLPPVQTVTGTVEVSNLGGCQSPPPLVATLVDQYVIQDQEVYVSDPIDVTEYFGGKIAIQTVTSGGVNGAIFVNPQWLLADGQVVPYDAPSGSEIGIDAFGTPASGLHFTTVEGRILRVRIRSFTGPVTVSVHIVASAD